MRRGRRCLGEELCPEVAAGEAREGVVFDCEVDAEAGGVVTDANAIGGEERDAVVVLEHEQEILEEDVRWPFSTARGIEDVLETRLLRCKPFMVRCSKKTSASSIDTMVS